jgi:hypothetical protein
MLLARVREKGSICTSNTFALSLSRIPERSKANAVQPARETREVVRMRVGEEHGKETRASSGA